MTAEEEEINTNTREGLIIYDRLIDSEISTNLITQDFSGNNPKEKTGLIKFVIENNKSGIIINEKTQKTVNKKENEINGTVYSTEVGIDESVIYNLNYKLKSAVNQINEYVKQMNN